jgi:transposase
MPGDLFSVSPGLNWLPDETVFSFASRHHRVTGNIRSADTCLQLFGHPRQGSAHDLPSRMNEFVNRTGGTLGDARAIIRNHTILPFFLPFRTKDDATAAFAALEGPSIGSLKYTLGLLTSRFRANHPLKACSLCMAVDRKEWSVAYWHRCHQLPGVWMCPTHFIPLSVATIKSTGVERFLWHLPEESQLVSGGFNDVENSTSDVVDEQLRQLADAAVEVVELSDDFHFNQDRLLAIYHKGLCEKNLTKPGGGLRLMELGQDYLENIGPLRIVPEFSSLPIDAANAQSQVSRLFYKPRSGTHPIRHLFIILWLFGDFKNFWRQYCDSPSPIEQIDVPQHPPTTEDERMITVLQLLREGSHTVSAAAKVVCVDTVTAMAWAARAGIETARRPKYLKGAIKNELLDDLRLGMDKSDAAKKFGISIVSVTRVLRTELGLQLAWHEARQNTARSKARAEWGHAIAANPGASTKSLRLIADRAYAWLYRNDRVWLNTQCGQLDVQTVTRKNIVDWDARDSVLADAVRRVCLDLAILNPSRRITLWQIYQKIPELKPKLSRLSSLPLTRLALEDGMRSSQHLQINSSLL